VPDDEIGERRTPMAERGTSRRLEHPRPEHPRPEHLRPEHLRPEHLRPVFPDEPAAADAGELLRAVARGDERSFGRLYDLVAPRVYGLVRRVLRDPALTAVRPRGGRPVAQPRSGPGRGHRVRPGRHGRAVARRGQYPAGAIGRHPITVPAR
jgi:hypothetical protein